MIHFASSDILPLYSFTVALIKLSTVSLQNFFFVTRSVTPQKPPGPDDAPSSSPATATRSVAHTWYPSLNHILLNACQSIRDKSSQCKTFLRHKRHSHFHLSLLSPDNYFHDLKAEVAFPTPH